MTTTEEQSPFATTAEATRTRGRPLRYVVGAVLAVAVAAGAFLVFRPATVTPDPPRDVPRLDGKFIRYSPAFIERAKLEFTTTEMAPLSPQVSVTGTVTFDPQRVAAVGARISGRVRKVFKFAGDAVKAGDVLAEVESAELGQAQSAVLSAAAHSEAAAANEKRESQLAEAKVSSQRDAELAHATASAASAELHAAQQRVHALGGSASNQIGVLAVTSPIPGKVVESHVSRGQSVEPSYTLFRVADLDRLWVELAVFERELGRIRAGDAVEVTPQTNAAIVLAGKVDHVGDVIDLETRSSEVRVVVENLDRALRPGQSVLAKIHTQTTAAPVLLLPREAVTSVDGKQTVFVAHDATSVEPRTVVIGARDGAHVEVTSGLTAGEKVATKGVFALKSEIFR
jgi:cobalt-zinc-cadmium efflux system membrane fusion protein